MMPRYTALTLDFANRLVSEVFDSESRQILALSKANNEEITVGQQLMDFFYGSFLRYPEDVTIRKAVYIFKYARHSLLKIKLLEDRMNELVTPENFFITNIRSIDNKSAGANINKADSTNIITKNEITFGTSDTVNLTEAHLTNRSATSQFNEDDVTLEDFWREEDKKDKKPLITEDKKLFNIKLPENLTDATVNSVIEEKKAIEFKSTLVETKPKTGDEFAVSYTNVGVNKNLSFTGVEGSSVSKGFTALSDKNVNNATTVQSNFGKMNTDITSKTYTYNEALFKTLNMQVQDFREIFFNSFSCLFISLWDGY